MTIKAVARGQQATNVPIMIALRFLLADIMVLAGAATSRLCARFSRRCSHSVIDGIGRAAVRGSSCGSTLFVAADYRTTNVLTSTYRAVLRRLATS